MPESTQEIRVGITSCGVKTLFCLCFKESFPVQLVMDMPREGLCPAVQDNQDGSRTVGYDSKQFGWRDTDRWEDFEHFAQEVRLFMSDELLQQTVALDLTPRSCTTEQASLFGGRDPLPTFTR